MIIYYAQIASALTSGHCTCIIGHGYEWSQGDCIVAGRAQTALQQSTAGHLSERPVECHIFWRIKKLGSKCHKTWYAFAWYNRDLKWNFWDSIFRVLKISDWNHLAPATNTLKAGTSLGGATRAKAARSLLWQNNIFLKQINWSWSTSWNWYLVGVFFQLHGLVGLSTPSFSTPRFGGAKSINDHSSAVNQRTSRRHSSTSSPKEFRKAPQSVSHLIQKTSAKPVIKER